VELSARATVSSSAVGSCVGAVASEAGSCAAGVASAATLSVDAVSVSTGSTSPWLMLETWSEVASAFPVIVWVMIASC